MGRHNNQPNDGVGSGMGIGEAMKQAERVGADFYSLLWVANGVTKK
jgi:hypothetical protein